MTKTLTEQWLGGTLPEGWYYCQYYDEVKKLYCGDGESLELDDPETSSYYFFHRENGKGQVGVLAPVPSYEEFQSYEKCADMLIDVNKKWEKTIKERKHLEKKLEIATKALKKLTRNCNKWELARKTLKEMEGVKWQK